MKKILMVMLSGGLASMVDVLHQASQGYAASDDLGHIAAAFGAGALISLAHIFNSTSTNGK